MFIWPIPFYNRYSSTCNSFILMCMCHEKNKKNKTRVWIWQGHNTCPHSIHMCLRVAYSSYLKVIRGEDEEIHFSELSQSLGQPRNYLRLQIEHYHHHHHRILIIVHILFYCFFFCLNTFRKPLLLGSLPLLFTRCLLHIIVKRDQICWYVTPESLWLYF